ncbi:MAG: hypothetical protein RL676_830, partial [Pseudomonadota bacterium]
PFPPDNPLILNGFFGFWGSLVRNWCAIRSNRGAESPQNLSQSYIDIDLG